MDIKKETRTIKYKPIPLSKNTAPIMHIAASVPYMESNLPSLIYLSKKVPTPLPNVKRTKAAN